MKRVIAGLAVAVASTMALAGEGFFPEAKAADACQVSYAWGRGFLSNLTTSGAAPVSCTAESIQAADAFAKSPPLLWWNVVQAPPADAPNGDCVMTLSWPSGAPSAATPTFATRVGGLNGTPVPTQPGCIADAHALAAYVVQLGGAAPKALRSHFEEAR
jgi:hypothetical protein